MTVSELIEELKKYSPNLEVVGFIDRHNPLRSGVYIPDDDNAQIFVIDLTDGNQSDSR